MIEESNAVERAREYARVHKREWFEPTIRVQRALVSQCDCWIVWTDTQSPETPWMEVETDSYMGYLIRVSDGRCVGMKFPFGLHLLPEAI